MKVIEFEKYGPAEVLQIVQKDIPEPGPGEIRIRIHSTAVNSGDWRVRRADPFLVRLFFGLFKPGQKARVLGSVLSGTVDAIGAEVTRFAPGDRVFGMSDLALGCYAQYICLPESAPVVKGVESLSHEEAASIPFGLHTAYHFLKGAHLENGKRMLVLGASGAVGSAAVQLGRIWGCEVTAVCSERNVELVKGLGANSVIDYEKDGLSDLKKFDVVIETVGKTRPDRLRNLVMPGGQLILVSGAMKDMLLAGIRSAIWKIKVKSGVALVSIQDMEYFRELIESGQYRPVLERSYDMSNVVAAHKHAENGHKRGNLALRMIT